MHFPALGHEEKSRKDLGRDKCRDDKKIKKKKERNKTISSAFSALSIMTRIGWRYPAVRRTWGGGSIWIETLQVPHSVASFHQMRLKENAASAERNAPTNRHTHLYKEKSGVLFVLATRTESQSFRSAVCYIKVASWLSCSLCCIA